jgi:hypothetical protein
MEINNPTDALTSALASWVTLVIGCLTEEQLNVTHACLNDPAADIWVQVRLKEGAMILQAIKDGRCLELLRQDVEPLRRADAFGHQGERSVQ